MSGLPLAKKRLLKDYKKIENEPPIGIYAAPNEDNIMKWRAVILGPDGTDWKDGVFNLTMEFKDDYPQHPPDIKFVTSIFHPNIYRSGAICLDILQNNWSPAYDISSVLTSIQSLLTDPNPASPANAEAANLYTSNRPEYVRRVRDCVEKSLIEKNKFKN